MLAKHVFYQLNYNPINSLQLYLALNDQGVFQLCWLPPTILVGLSTSKCLHTKGVALLYGLGAGVGLEPTTSRS